jgi:hypothetical protein
MLTVLADEPLREEPASAVDEICCRGAQRILAAALVAKADAHVGQITEEPKHRTTALARKNGHLVFTFHRGLRPSTTAWFGTPSVPRTLGPCCLAPPGCAISRSSGANEAASRPFRSRTEARRSWGCPGSSWTQHLGVRTPRPR